MTEKQDPNQPSNSPRPKQPNNPPKRDLELEAKRAQNLRDNLLKRKLQARARSETDSDQSA